MSAPVLKLFFEVLSKTGQEVVNKRTRKGVARFVQVVLKVKLQGDSIHKALLRVILF